MTSSSNIQQAVHLHSYVHAIRDLIGVATSASPRRTNSRLAAACSNCSMQQNTQSNIQFWCNKSEMPFESLPSEVQIEIFSYLEGPNLKTVRGVCRTFRDNAEPTLFRYVIATARYQSLGAFQKISLFKVFQKHVREIVFDGSVYNKLLAKHEQFYHRQAAKFSSLERGFHWHKHSRCATQVSPLQDEG